MVSKLSGGQGHRNQPHLAAWRVLRRLAGVHRRNQKTYDASVYVAKPSRFFVMDAPVFAQFMKDQFPMAVHLLDGIAVGTDRPRRNISN